MPFKIVPAFQEVFQSFNADMPMVTVLVLRFYPALLALPVCVIASWLLWPRKERRGRAALLLGAASVVVVPLALVLVMYLPILRLAAVTVG
ncbi:MAG TPA: hypothetical protein VKI18_06850 [Albitalea sp.]|nr:hypothetical protein [Albitalea sp.]